jgi:hypothetical protein
MSIGRLNKRIAKRLSAVETAAGKGKKRLFLHEGSLPGDPPGSRRIIAGFADDTHLPPGWVYAPGMSPAEKLARYATGDFTPPRPTPDQSPEHQTPVDLKRRR